MQYLLPAILTAVFSFCVGFLLWQIKKERVSLEYECGGSGTFPREKGIGRYFIVEINNSGNKPIQDVKFIIIFPSGRIESANYSEHKLVSDVSIDGSQLSGSIPLLNPKEMLGVTITIMGESDIGSPKIIARAVGVTAVQRKEGSIFSHRSILMAGVLGTLAIAVTVVFVWRITLQQEKVTDESIKTLKGVETITGDFDKNIDLFKKNLQRQQEEQEKTEKEEQQGKPETEQIVFAILNRAGLGHLMFRLIESGEEITYWKTGFVLLQAFLVDQENGGKYVNAME
jgi:hypothetical protein